jgi:plasmid stabilization system protein ParE
MRQVLYHPKVPAEARTLLQYYASISPRLGDAFWDELLAAIDKARESPTEHHFDRTGLRRSNLRRFPVHFLVRILPSAIRITVVRHDRRHPDYGTERR